MKITMTPDDHIAACRVPSLIHYCFYLIADKTEAQDIFTDSFIIIPSLNDGPSP
jgi:hypothetical protein